VGHARDRNRRGPFPRRVRLLNVCLILQKINYQLVRVHSVQLPHQISSLTARQFLGKLKTLFIGPTFVALLIRKQNTFKYTI